MASIAAIKSSNELLYSKQVVSKWIQEKKKRNHHHPVINGFWQWKLIALNQGVNDASG